ncbi:MAG: hypothetical protein RR145_03825, partial [Oscillospiraceae bacterium]
ERKANMKFYEENGIPTLTQTYGQEYVNFFDATKAWEKEWHGNVLGPGAGYELAGTGHASAMPHPATREAFGRVIKSATEHGFSGFGFPDCVWMWGARGVTGYNEKTLQAFTEDVTKRDRGLRVRLDGVNVTTMNFWDYYSYYAGNDVLNPADIGFASWNDYHPLTVEEWRGMTSAEAIPRLGLFDILCHYEWLKMVQFSADTAQENGGVCQIMPNPEYHPNGVDYLFLNAIENVDMTSEEFFGDTSYLDGAYYRYPYITGFGKGDNVSVGGVMEAGGGGNAGAYYTPEIAYATAYELGASGLEHLETDFWAQSPLDDLKKNENLQRRDTQIMSYGMGFNDSKKDALSKPKGDFVCVSNRRIFRPWSPGNAWEPWTLNLKKAGEVDFVLGKMGYNFDGISQEGLEKMELPQRAVVYSPNKATSRDLEKFCTMVNDGSINNGIISATTLRDRVDSKLNSGAITGDFAYSDNHGVQNVSGNIMAGSTVLKENAKLVGTLYKKKGTDKTVLRHQQASGATRDILVSRQTGKGTMYILLFDPTLTENYQLSEAVYDYLFGTLEIKPRWKSVENTAVLTDGFTQPDTFSETMKNDLCASVRVYENKENLTVDEIMKISKECKFIPKFKIIEIIEQFKK